MSPRRKVLAALLLVVALGFLFLFSREAGGAARKVVAWVSSAGPWAFLVYILSVAGTVITLLPGGILPLGGGFLFGLAKGTALFVAGEMLGAALAFGIARRFLGPKLRRRFARHPRLAVLDASLAGEGWRIIAMTRLVPFFPFKLSNYFFGSMGVRFRDFFWGTLLGTLPLSLLLVYLGSLTADLAALEGGKVWEKPGSLAFLLTLSIAGLGGLAFLSRRIGRAYRLRMETLSRTPARQDVEG